MISSKLNLKRGKKAAAATQKEPLSTNNTEEVVHQKARKSTPEGDSTEITRDITRSIIHGGDFVAILCLCEKMQVLDGEGECDDYMMQFLGYPDDSDVVQGLVHPTAYAYGVKTEVAERARVGDVVLLKGARSAGLSGQVFVFNDLEVVESGAWKLHEKSHVIKTSGESGNTPEKSVSMEVVDFSAESSSIIRRIASAMRGGEDAVESRSSAHIVDTVDQLLSGGNDKDAVMELDCVFTIISAAVVNKAVARVERKFSRGVRVPTVNHYAPQQSQDLIAVTLMGRDSRFITMYSTPENFKQHLSESFAFEEYRNGSAPITRNNYSQRSIARLNEAVTVATGSKSLRDSQLLRMAKIGLSGGATVYLTGVYYIPGWNGSKGYFLFGRESTMMQIAPEREDEPALLAAPRRGGALVQIDPDIDGESETPPPTVPVTVQQNEYIQVTDPENFADTLETVDSVTSGDGVPVSVAGVLRSVDVVDRRVILVVEELFTRVRVKLTYWIPENNKDPCIDIRAGQLQNTIWNKLDASLSTHIRKMIPKGAPSTKQEIIAAIKNGLLFGKTPSVVHARRKEKFVKAAKSTIRDLDNGELDEIIRVLSERGVKYHSGESSSAPGVTSTEPHPECNDEDEGNNERFMRYFKNRNQTSTGGRRHDQEDPHASFIKNRAFSLKSYSSEYTQHIDNNGYIVTIDKSGDGYTGNKELFGPDAETQTAQIVINGLTRNLRIGEPNIIVVHLARIKKSAGNREQMSAFTNVNITRESIIKLNEEIPEYHIYKEMALRAMPDAGASSIRQNGNATHRGAVMSELSADQRHCDVFFLNMLPVDFVSQKAGFFVRDYDEVDTSGLYTMLGRIIDITPSFGFKEEQEKPRFGNTPVWKKKKEAKTFASTIVKGSFSAEIVVQGLRTSRRFKLDKEAVVRWFIGGDLQRFASIIESSCVEYEEKMMSSQGSHRGRLVHHQPTETHEDIIIRQLQTFSETLKNEACLFSFLVCENDTESRLAITPVFTIAPSEPFIENRVYREKPKSCKSMEIITECLRDAIHDAISEKHLELRNEIGSAREVVQGPFREYIADEVEEQPDNDEETVEQQDGTSSAAPEHNRDAKTRKRIDTSISDDEDDDEDHGHVLKRRRIVDDSD